MTDDNGLHGANGAPPAPLDVDETASDADLEMAEAILASSEHRLRLAQPNEQAWRLRLVKKQTWVPSRKEFVEMPLSCPLNVALYLTYHPEWAGVLAFDELADAPVCLRPPPRVRELDARPGRSAGAWTDADTAHARAWLSALPFGEAMQCAADVVESAIAMVTDAHRTSPVADYLRQLVWDQTERLPALAVDYLGVAPSTYACEAGKRWAIGAVARALRPGCQMDTVLVLEGFTGAGKSSGLRALCPDPRWYTETPVSLDTKDAYEALRGRWIVCLDELGSLARSEHTRALTFLTSVTDSYRPPYARRSRQFSRRCVFVATTEREQWLGESTGLRRWLPLRVERGAVDRVALARDRDQIWAEAVARLDAGEPWYLDTPELVADARQRQLERVLPGTDGEVYREAILRHVTSIAATELTLRDVLVALEVPAAQWSGLLPRQLGAALRGLGWTPAWRGGRERRERCWRAPAPTG